MNLSFSTRGWAECSWEEWLDTATDMHFGGIEVYNAHLTNALFEKGGPFHKYSISATVRTLNEKKLTIPCLDSSCDLSLEDGSAVADVKALMDIARDLRVSCVCAFASSDRPEAIRAAIAELLDYAAQKQVILLIKSSGLYANTTLLRELMNDFACDELAVLWDVHHTCRDAGEAPDATIKNLGAYVKHVHLRDSDDDLSYNLIGEGTLPIPGVMQALASINYDGFISLEWKPEWMEDLQDREIIFPYFINYMNRFESPRMLKKPLYFNQAQTGQYVWKKEALIETTFSRVLDRMVEEFPDQTAIKYTTLNYTRTYAEFREDVDSFACSLIALGVKPGRAGFGLILYAKGRGIGVGRHYHKAGKIRLGNLEGHNGRAVTAHKIASRRKCPVLPLVKLLKTLRLKSVGNILHRVKGRRACIYKIKKFIVDKLVHTISPYRRLNFIVAHYFGFEHSD